MIIETVKGRIYRTFFNANTGDIGESLSQVYRGEPLNRKSVAWYFTVGYVPGDMTLFDNIFCLPGGAVCKTAIGGYEVLKRFHYEDLIDKKKYESVDQEELLDLGHETLLRIVEQEYLKDKNVALGLTGGLDSRLLLGALLEVTDASNLEAFSWGFQNGYDLEIGRLTAKKFGVKHTSYQLDKIPFELSNLETFALISDCNTNLFEQPPISQLLTQFSGHTIWYGMLGGTASGSNLPISRLETPVTHYLTMERKRTGSLSNVAYSLLGVDICPRDVEEVASSYLLSSHDMMDIYNHHERLISHTVFYRNVKYSVPFASDDWLSYCLSLPNELRGPHRKILVESIKKYYPKIASLPSANFKGMSLFRSRNELLLSRMREIATTRMRRRHARKKFIELRSLYSSPQWKAVLASYLTGGKVPFNDVGPKIEVLLQEAGGIDHWKTLELLLSLAIIVDVLNKNSA